MTEAARRYGFGASGHRTFRLLVIGQGISLVGTWMQNVGEGWLILTLTNSPFYVGLTAALSSLGVLLFSTYVFFSSRRRHTRSVSAFLLNRSSDLLSAADLPPSPTKSSNLSETAEVPACNVPSRSPLPALAIAPETKLGTASSGLGTLEP